MCFSRCWSTLVQTCVSSRLDYCNYFLVGVAEVHLCRLQSVENAAAPLVSDAGRHDHITPVLATLRWLPVCHTASCVQDSSSCVEVPKRWSVALPSRSLCPGCIHWWSSSVAVCSVWSSSGAVDPDFHWPAQLRSTWSENMEQAAGCTLLTRT